MTNRKLHTHFRLDWMTLNGHCAFTCTKHASFGAHHENLNEDRSEEAWNDSGIIENVDFQCFRMLRLRNLRKWGQHYMVLFSPLSPFQFHWPQNTWPWITLNGHFTLNSVFAHVRLEFLRRFCESKCVKNNNGVPILSAAKMFSVDSSFWRCRVYAEIRGILKFFICLTAITQHGTDFPAFSWVLSLWLAGWLAGGKSCLSRVACLSVRVGPARTRPRVPSLQLGTVTLARGKSRLSVRPAYARRQPRYQ